MKRAFLLLPILLLSGCSGQNYASKLNLPPITAPAVLAPVPTQASEEDDRFIASIQNAQTPAQAEAVMGQVKQGLALAGMLLGDVGANDTPEQKQTRAKWQAEYNRLGVYYEQAAQIKKAQLEDGDAKDSTGEVAQRIAYVRQSSANLEELNKGLPKLTDPISSGGFAPEPPTGAAAPSTTPVQNTTPSTGAQPFTVAEQAWFDNLGAVHKSNPSSYIGLSIEEKATLQKNEAIQAQAQYKQVPAPPRFAAANSLFEAAHAKMVEAFTVLERATIARDRDGLTQGEQLLDEAQDLFDKAHAEANLVLDEVEGTPRPR